MKPKLPIGIVYALAAAALFGASTPLSKLLLGSVDPWLLAGLLYLGSGSGLSLWLLLASRLTGKHSTEASLKRADLPWLAGAILFGGVAGPVLLMMGLASTPAASASLLLNLESVLTALLAWFVFKENFDRRIALGMAFITGGGVLLSWTGDTGCRGSVGCAGDRRCVPRLGDRQQPHPQGVGREPHPDRRRQGAGGGRREPGPRPCRRVALAGRPDRPGCRCGGPAGVRGEPDVLRAGPAAFGDRPHGAYFSLAPFVGAAMSLAIFQDGLSIRFGIAAALMGVGVWLHLTERHEHEHTHEPMEHDHSHVHDEHHRHEHSPDDPPGEPHSHPHRHEAMTHTHAHYPDIHHRHEH